MAHVWEKSYPAGVSWSDPFPPAFPIEKTLEFAAMRWPDGVVIDFYDRLITYRELLETSKRVAAGLQALGIGPGAHVGLYLPNTPHYVACFFGVLMAGGRVVNFSPQAGERELKAQLLDSDAHVIVTLDQPALYRRAAALKGTSERLTIVVCSLSDYLSPQRATQIGGPSAERMNEVPQEISFADLLANDGVCAEPVHGDLEDDVAVIQYTGGTTGESKGAMLTHANLSSIIFIYYRWYGLGQSAGGDDAQSQPEQNKFLVVLPLVHILGLSCVMLLSVASGSKMILHLRFDAAHVLSDIDRKKVVAFVGTPTMFKAIAQHSHVGKFDLSSLLVCSSGGSALPAPTLRSFVEAVGRPLGEGYGLTELSPLGTMHPDGQARPGTVGLPVPRTMVEVVDIETGMTVLPLGETGEICFTGPQVMKGYWRREAETEHAFRGGRFHTGDIGYLDQDGFLRLVDRKKDMINSGGFKIFPRTVEDAILEYPGVAEAAVVGIPQPDLGQVAKAFIVMEQGQPALTYRKLRAFLADKLAAYEIPVTIEIWQALPRTPLGKISKTTLLAAEADKLKAATLQAKR